jgi:predicted nuclease of predicted toxin-antitoxin system
MIAVLLDQGLAPRATAILRDRTFDAIHVMEIGMAESDDADILEMARNHNRVCVTLDHDFHTHLALAGQGHPSVILLRIEGLSADAQADQIESICRPCQIALSEGAAISADGITLRIRRLPLR